MSTAVVRLQDPGGPPRHRAIKAFATTAILAACWGFGVEPRLVPWREDHHLLLPARPGTMAAGAVERLRLAHLADLHIDSFDRRLERLAEDVVAARPDLILVSGDLLADRHDLPTVEARSAATARFVAALGKTAPVFAVEGHADHHGLLVRRLAEAGVVWLRNEGIRLGDIALLGLSQQSGSDRFVPAPPADFTWSSRGGDVVVSYGHEGKRRNVYLTFDPGPATGASGPSDADPLGWSGVDLRCEVAIDEPSAAVGIAVHSREPVGEHRGLRLARARANPDESGSFALTFDGSWPDEGALDTGVAPEVGRWYSLRLRTTVQPEAVRVEAKVWPAGTVEPGDWQAWAVDRGPTRATAGTVALWGWGGGAVHWRRLAATDATGTPLPVAFPTPNELGAGASGFRVAPRASRLALARGRLPGGLPGDLPGGLPSDLLRVTPPAVELVLAHSPDSIFEVAAEGAEVMFAGHTHGGQVRLPGLGALTTRSFLGAEFDQGRFRFAATTTSGFSELFISPGIGTSFLPLRFASPPTWGLLELEVVGPPG